MLEFQDKLWSNLTAFLTSFCQKNQLGKPAFFLKMTCPLAGHDLVVIGTVVHPDLLKYALGVNKYPPKRRDTESDLFLKKKKMSDSEKSI